MTVISIAEIVSLTTVSDQSWGLQLSRKCYSYIQINMNCDQESPECFTKMIADCLCWGQAGFSFLILSSREGIAGSGCEYQFWGLMHFATSSSQGKKSITRRLTIFCQDTCIPRRACNHQLTCTKWKWYKQAAQCLQAKWAIFKIRGRRLTSTCFAPHRDIWSVSLQAEEISHV